MFAGGRREEAVRAREEKKEENGESQSQKSNQFIPKLQWLFFI